MLGETSAASRFAAAAATSTAANVGVAFDIAWNRLLDAALGAGAAVGGSGRVSACVCTLVSTSSRGATGGGSFAVEIVLAKSSGTRGDDDDGDVPVWSSGFGALDLLDRL